MRMLGLFTASLLTLAPLSLPALSQPDSLTIQLEFLELSEAEHLDQQAEQLRQQGKYQDAITLAQQSVAIYERLLGSNNPNVASSLNNLADLYQDQGNYKAAEPLYQRALKLLETSLGDNHFNVANTLNNLALLYRAQGNYKAAEPLLQRSLSIRETALGKTHSDVAASLHNLASLYQDQGNYAAAEPLFLRSLAIWETALGKNHPDVATNLNGLANLYQAQGNYAAAEPLHQRSLKIRENALGATHPDVAASLHNLASLYGAQGNYAAAEPLFLRSLAIWETALGKNHPDVAASLHNLASLYQAQGNYAAAEPLYQRSLSIRETALGKNHPDVAASLNGLANLYQDQGNYAAAEPLFLRSLAIWETALGKNHPDVATSLNGLANLYQAQGNYAAAEPLYQRSLSIRETMLGKNHPDVATSLNDLAALYRAQGNYATAEPLYLRSLAIRETALGKTHPDVANSLNGLANLYQDQGNYAAAEPLFQRSLAIWETALGKSHPDVAANLNNLATLYQAQGNYATAEPLFQRSLAIKETMLGKTHPDVAINLNNLASLYQAQGNYAAAELLYLRSLAIWETAFSKTHPNIVSNLNNLASVHWAEGRVDGALEFRQRSLAIEESNLAQNLAVGNESQKRAYAQLFTASTNAAISLHLQAAPTNPTAANLALTTILRRKGRVLDVLSDSFQRLRQDLSPENQAQLDQLANLRRQYSNLANAIDSKQPVDQRRTQMATLEQQANQLEADLSRRSAAFRLETQPVEIAAVQAQIPANTVLIEFYRYQPFNPKAKKDSEKWGKHRYAAYWLSATGVPQWRDLGDAATIDAAIQDFQVQLLRPPTDRAAKLAGRQLDALILEPIRQSLGSTRRLLIAPDSQLNLIPFAALVDAQNRYLVETYEISYLTSGRDLLRLQSAVSTSPTPPLPTPPTLFAQIDHTQPGNPNSIALIQQNKTRPASPLAQNQSRSALRSAGFNLQFRNLDHTGDEATAIQRYLTNPLLLTNTNATENALKALVAPPILHLATHGFFLPQQAQLTPDRPTPPGWENPLLRSGLVFAGSNIRQSGNEDGVLTALEASALRLKGTQLVVMSACQTGLGDVADGEGVYGLRRSLVLAGAETQVMTLWSVNDEATRYWMESYYEKLKAGGDRSASLRQIQLAFLNHPNYKHPAYWAAFTLTGSWKPL